MPTLEKQTLDKPISEKHNGGRPRAAVPRTVPILPALAVRSAAPYTPAELADMKQEYTELYPRVKGECGRMRGDADPADVRRFRELVLAGEKMIAYRNSRAAYKTIGASLI